MSSHHSTASAAKTVTVQTQTDSGASAAAAAASAKAAHQAQMDAQKSTYRAQIGTKNTEVAASNAKITSYQNDIQDLTEIEALLESLMDRVSQEKSSCQNKYESNIQSDWKGHKYSEFHGKYETVSDGLNAYESSVKSMKHEIDNALRNKKIALAWEQNVVRNAQMLIASLESLIASLI